jgi:hypothetical protein
MIEPVSNSIEDSPTMPSGWASTTRRATLESGYGHITLTRKAEEAEREEEDELDEILNDLMFNRDDDHFLQSVELPSLGGSDGDQLETPLITQSPQGKF